jgi:tetratricopeptide (TPR) repeat protein
MYVRQYHFAFWCSLVGCACVQAQSPGGRVVTLRDQANVAIAAVARDSMNIDRLYDAGSLLIRDEDPRGLPYLKKVIALDRSPSSRTAFAHGYLAEAYFMTGQYADAGREFGQALAMDPGNPQATSFALMLGYDSVYRGWKIYETPHLRLHVSPASGITDLSRFANARESALLPITQVFPSPPLKKIDLFVWSSADEANRTRLPVLLSYSLPGFGAAHVLASQPAGRELAHVVSARALGTTEANALMYYGLEAMFDQPGTDLKSDARRAVRAAGIGPVDIRGLWRNWHLYPDTVASPLAAAFLAAVLQRGGKEQFAALVRRPQMGEADNLYGTQLQVWIDDFQRDMRAY